MQTTLHITALVNELKDAITGGIIYGTEFYKKERSAFFFIKKEKSRMALGFVYHPAGSGTFLVPASKIKITTREKPWPVFDLVKAVITDVEQMGFDRIFSIKIENGGLKKTLVFEAIGPNGNIWLLDEKGNKSATLRNRKYISGEKYVCAPPPGKLSPFDVTSSHLEKWAEGEHIPSFVTMLEKKILGLNRIMAKEIIRRAGLEGKMLQEIDDRFYDGLVKSINDTTSFFNGTSPGYLYELKSGNEVYPFKLSIVDQAPEKYKSLSLAVMNMVNRRRLQVVEADEEKKVLETVRRSLKRLENRLVKIEKDIEEASGFEDYKKIGELIQINLSKIKKGMKQVALEDIYAVPPEEIIISLDPALTPVENAEAYFKKHRKGREGLELLKRRLEISQQEREQMALMLADLETDFESSFKRYEKDLLPLMPKENGKAELAPRLPYRVFTLMSGLTIYVGRDGSDNDRTTFEFARPYELWFHTQQCPGSHVVVKFPNKSFIPSKSEIQEAASIAAFFSKARKDGLVPVIYTERKYVRKPRKAKPGLVTVEREKSIMVTPRKPN